MSCWVCVMGVLQRGRVVVVTANDAGTLLAERLRVAALMQITEVVSVGAARDLCAQRRADACLVIYEDEQPDERSTALPAAPGSEFGVPSLVLAGVVTPYLCKAARRAGYFAVVCASVAPRLLYRRIGGALQRRRCSRAATHTILTGHFGRLDPQFIHSGKPTLH